MAVWSNFSAQRPVINPSAPRIKDPKKAPKNIKKILWICISIISEKAKTETIKIVMLLVMAASIMANVTSAAESGA